MKNRNLHEAFDKIQRRRDNFSTLCTRWMRVCLAAHFLILIISGNAEAASRRIAYGSDYDVIFQKIY
ncbi:hypothetical protein, partial [Corallococcus exiguus]|uniref:hypothetical protein n=1 Tax=Corallococcus exiguus TaxID=83462 RepID=UPI001B8CAEF1